MLKKPRARSSPLKLRIDHDSALMADELRLRDPDAFVMLEFLRWQHGEDVFELADSGRPLMPPGDWSLPRFTEARTRLVAKGFMVAVAETIQ